MLDVQEADPWGALHAPRRATAPPSAAGGGHPRVDGDRHDDPRGCAIARRSMKVTFAVERRERHMVRPRSAFLGRRALGVNR